MTIDIICVIFIIILAFQGYRKGFVKTIFDTLGLVISFFLSKGFYHFAEGFILNNTKLFVKLHDYFEMKLAQNVADNISSTIPAGLQKFVNNIVATEASDTFAVFVNNISLLLIRTISFLVTFLIIYAILLILSILINAIMKLPLLNITNRVFGAFMGILKGVILLCLIFALAAPPLSLMHDKALAQSVLNSESAKFFYDNNLILNYLSHKGFYEN